VVAVVVVVVAFVAVVGGALMLVPRKKKRKMECNTDVKRRGLLKQASYLELLMVKKEVSLDIVVGFVQEENIHFRSGFVVLGSVVELVEGVFLVALVPVGSGGFEIIPAGLEGVEDCLV
jgi:uncharacterized membrane protein